MRKAAASLFLSLGVAAEQPDEFPTGAGRRGGRGIKHLRMA
jgi:hypothetical protein